MNILMLGNFGTGWDGSICDEVHIANALTELGHHVTRQQREATGKGTVWHLPDQVDFVLIAQWNGYDVGLVKDLREYAKCPIVYWAFDYQYDKNDAPAPEEWHMRLAAECDIFLSKEMAHASIYRHLGCNFYWLPQDFSPEFLDRPEEEPTTDYDIIFTGSHLPWAPERNELVKTVADNFDLHVFSVTQGNWSSMGIENSHGPVMDRDLMNLYSRAKIVLSIDWKHSEGYWSDRNAQAMCCGAFVLFKWVPLSESTFRNGIGYFYNAEDMLEKIQYFLDHPTERYTTAFRGYIHAQKNLKVKDRVEDMLTIVESQL